MNMEIFQQLIELDDDDETHEFSYSTATGFFSQAEGTFDEMDEALSVQLGLCLYDSSSDCLISQ
jgi:hypothetical protein